MRVDLPTGTVTFLFTDVEGSTKLLHELGAEAYAEALAEHRRVIREACAAEGGVEVDTQGDAFFFAFPTAPGALAAASAVTEALSPGPIHVRVGLHTGTPLVTEEGYVGGDVHRAARIAAAGYGGQVLVSSSTAQLVELELADLGEHRLKDLSAPERIFQLDDGEFPALKSLYRTNLPVPATPFLGREQELAEVLALLSAGETRLLTLTGPGGTGKTRLALQAVAEASDRYADGVWWVPLAPLREPALVLETAAQVVGSKNGLAEHISDKSMLCLFDNFEQVVEAGAELASLLASCPNLDVVVTSRERLRVSGEQTYPVPPLGEEDGEALFSARARAVDPSFVASEAVAELCSRLDELPLALELAAARTALFSPEQLLERLAQRLDLLKGDRDADPRQQTLRATIEWSYDLLSEEEQRLFARLSVFAGGCTYEAAEQVADADPDTLQSLLDKSLVRKRESEAEPRYWMLETIREYAAEQLDNRGEAEVQRRYRRYFLALAEKAEPDLWGGRAEATAHIGSENENLRAALGSALADGDAESALRIAVSIYRFWEQGSRYGEARDWLSQALAHEGGTVDLRARALMGIGRAASLQCDWNDAIAALESSAGSFRDVEDRVGISRCLGFLGHTYLFTGDAVRAAEVLEENLVIARETADEQTIQNAVYNLAFAYVERGELTRAQEALEEARRLADSLHNEYGVAVATIVLGNVAVLAGDYERAAIQLRGGLQRAEGTRSPLWIFDARRYLARLALIEGRIGEAEQVLISLFGHRRDDIPRREFPHWLNDLAAVAAAKGDAPRTAVLVGAADAAFESLGLVLLQEDHLLRDRFVPLVREALEEDHWRAAWTEGHEMNIADALAYALEPSPLDVS